MPINKIQNNYTNSNTDITKNAKSSENSVKNLNSMINQMESQTKNFEKLVSSVFEKQVNKFQLAKQATSGNLKSFFKNLTIDSKTIEKAKEAVSENGYYGVNKTSERILSFAKASAGSDPRQLEKMKKSVEKGFKKVEKMWGGKLPEISQKTYDKVMSEFEKLEGLSV